MQPRAVEPIFVLSELHSAMISAVFLAVKLPLDRLRHRKLDIIEGIAGLLHDIVIDSEYFIRKRLSGWIEDGHELIADTVSDGHAEGIEIPCDIVDLVKPIWGRRVQRRGSEWSRPSAPPPVPL